MFVVYSPEGQSFVGAVSHLPTLKVDPSKSINRVEEAEMHGLNVEAEQGGKGRSSSSAVHAYEANQKNQQRRAVVNVAEIMSSPVVTVTADTLLEESWRMMNERYLSYLPVLDNGVLVGICSQADLLARVIVDKSGELEGVKRERVAEVMHEQVITTTPDTDIRHVAQVLSGYDVGALVIMSELQQILGIVTEGDLVSRLANEPPLELYI